MGGFKLTDLGVLAGPIGWGAAAYGRKDDLKNLLGGKEKEVNQVPLMEQFQLDAGQDLSDFYKKYLSSYTPGASYDGFANMTTPTSQESAGLNRLSKYLDAPDSETLALSSDVINKTLRGDYDPYKSEYYAGMKRNLTQERDVAMKEAKRTAAKYGYRTSSGENRQLGQVAQNTSNKLSDLIAQIQENERQRQLAAVPYGLQVADAKNNEQLKKIGASQTYGSLSRTLENVGYQDFLRKQNELGGSVNIAQSLFGTQVPYGVKNMSYTEPGLLQQLTGAAAQMAPYAMMMM